MTGARVRSPWPVRAWIGASKALLFAELRIAASLLAALLVIILTNVVTRYAGVPIYWIDELAVFVMAWLAFIGASAMTRLRLDFAIGFLAEAVPDRLAPLVRAGSVLLVIAFGVAVAWMSWLWLDPAGLAAAGFDGRRLARETFNFVYTETTITLGWRRWAVMAVVPLFAVTLTVHGVAVLLEEVFGLERTAVSGFEGGAG